MVITAFLILFLHSQVWANGFDTVKAQSINEIGFIVAYGKGNISEGSYEPVMIICRLGYDMKNFFSGLKGHRGTLSVYIEPQVNPVLSPENDLELGIGVGLKYMYPVTDYVSAYIFASVGPHYITVVTRDQTNGLLFSNTVGVGLSLFVTDRSAIMMEYRLRHLSNADLGKPNAGIDNHFGAIGYAGFF